MKKIKNKKLLLALIGMLNANVIGCNSDELLMSNETSIESLSDDDLSTLDMDIQERVATEVNSIYRNQTITLNNNLNENTVKSKLESYPNVTANADVNIRDKDRDGEILGVLKSNSSLEVLDVLENGWYKVKYYNQIGYISGDYVRESFTYDFKTEITKMGYAVEDTKIIIPDYLSKINIEEEKIIPALECFEVYGEDENNYLVKTNDYIGYIEKDAMEELKGTFVAVDISDQELKLYSDNEVILSTPVVTGAPSTPTDEGLFEIYDITHNRYLIGPNYKTYVDIMMKYNGGEGLHDAEYHTNDDGFKHGWRNPSEFGGQTYKTDGSHGCVNMLHDDVMEVSKHVSVGTKVLVKK